MIERKSTTTGTKHEKPLLRKRKPLNEEQILQLTLIHIKNDKGQENFESQ